MAALNDVMQRRRELLARIAAQREQVAELGARLQAPLAFADRGLAVARFLRSNPVLTAGVFGLAVFFRRRGILGAVQGAWRLWKKYRYLGAIAAGL